MLNTNHSRPGRRQRDYPPAWFAAPVTAVLAAMIAFTMLPHEPGAPRAKPAETSAAAPQPGSASARPQAGWFSMTEPLPNVLD